MGYSSHSRAYRVFNKRTLCIEESIHVKFDENTLYTQDATHDDDILEQDFLFGDSSKDQNQEVPSTSKLQEDLQDNPQEHPDLPKEWRFATYHPTEQIIGDPGDRVRTRASINNVVNHFAFLSQIEPKNIGEAESDESWMLAMQEELNQFERNHV